MKEHDIHDEMGRTYISGTAKSSHPENVVKGSFVVTVFNGVSMQVASLSELCVSITYYKGNFLIGAGQILHARNTCHPERFMVMFRDQSH